jgi:hypothetical protein
VENFLNSMKKVGLWKHWKVLFMLVSFLWWFWDHCRLGWSQEVFLSSKRTLLRTVSSGKYSKYKLLPLTWVRYLTMTLSFLCWLTLEVPEKVSVANSVLVYLFYNFFFFLFSLYYQDCLFCTLSFSVLASKESMQWVPSLYSPVSSKTCSLLW